MGFIYGWKIKGTSDWLYVGQTKKDTPTRLLQELKELIKQGSFNGIEKHPLRLKWLELDGFNNITIEILEQIDNDGTPEYFERLNERERHWITTLGTHASEGGCNLTRGGQDGFTSWETEQRVIATKEVILEFVRTNGRRPSSHIPEEVKLSCVMRSYISPSSESFDSDFKDELDSIPASNVTDSDGRKQEILEFVKTKGRRPSRLIPEEYKLSCVMRSYINPSSDCFDSDFKDELDSIPITTKLQGEVEKNQQEILEFVKTNGRRPSSHIPEEVKLWGVMKSYISPSHNCFDSDFKEELDSIPASNVTDSDGRKQEILEFVRTKGRRPSRCIPEEVKLWGVMSSYISPSSGCFDSDFKEELDSIYVTNVLYKDKALMIYAFINTFKRLPKANWEIKDEYNVYIAYNEYFGKLPTKSKEEIQALKDKIDTILNQE